MELWIEAQDKNALRKINTSLYLREDLSDYAEGNVWFIVSGGDKLGEYKTKERALEVLGEIKNIIRTKFVVTLNYKAALSTVPLDEGTDILEKISVYEMPKE